VGTATDVVGQGSFLEVLKRGQTLPAIDAMEQVFVQDVAEKELYKNIIAFRLGVNIPRIQDERLDCVWIFSN
jgi:hypothetical protein